MKITRQDKTENKIKFINIKSGDCFKLVEYNDNPSDIFIKLSDSNSDTECKAASLIDGQKHYIADSDAIIALDAELIIREA